MSSVKGKVNVRIGDNDISLLYDLYRHRVMHTSQIQRLHFPNAYHHSYKRLQRLRKAGYIRHLPAEEKKEGVKVKSSHYITDRGIRILQERNVIPEREHEKSAAFLQPLRQRYLMDACEVYTQVAGVPWVFLTGPEVKRKYNLNRTTEVTGSLTNHTGEYLFYIISDRTRDETLRKIKAELQHNEQVEHLLYTVIFYKGERARQRWSDFTTGVAFHMLPFTDEGFTYLRSMAYPLLIPTLCKIKFNGEVVRTDIRNSITDWQSSDGKMLVTELFTNDMVKKKLLSLYSQQHAKERGKEVVIFVSKKVLSHYKNEFSSYPHFLFVGIEPEEIERAIRLEQERKI
ncbi:replication-relaxation family protein [Aneurinibacillus thermoaerophilus]|uniref:replication-relaxation family protein n=1 Tax=Aneurinibacillus thermoaerophilus TaxID=143495 RepID=UPI002E2450A0|nr:replication-relaxation family protein [Aneurinibacillus thermoaerophilus]